MDFKKKLKTRLIIGIIYVFIGLIGIIGACVFVTNNEFISSFGLTLVVIGVVRIRNYFIVTKDEERIRKQFVAETDERNVAISNKAKSTAFSIYTMTLCVVVIVLSFLGKTTIAQWIGLAVCLLITIYWISYFIYQKKL